MKDPREVLADRIEKWNGKADLYNYVDRLLADLDAAGYEIAPRSCLAPGCTEELGAFCEHHGFVLYGADNGRRGEPRMERTVSFREDVAMVLTVYDEHVPPENAGPWRDRLAAFAEMDVMERIESEANQGEQ